jgi:hypothetical protein
MLLLGLAFTWKDELRLIFRKIQVLMSFNLTHPDVRQLKLLLRRSTAIKARQGAELITSLGLSACPSISPDSRRLDSSNQKI